MINNEQAKDCAALAAFSLGADKKFVYALMHEMKVIFDLYTDEEIAWQLKRHFQKDD